MVPLSSVKWICLYHCQLRLDQVKKRQGWQQRGSFKTKSSPNQGTCLINCHHINHAPITKAPGVSSNQTQAQVISILLVQRKSHMYKAEGPIQPPSTDFCESLIETWSDRASGPLTKKTLQVKFTP